jgi:hypothetical protein
MSEINARSARLPGVVGTPTPQRTLLRGGADLAGSVSKWGDPVSKVGSVVQETGRGLPKTVEIVKSLKKSSDYAQLALLVADAMTGERPSASAIDAIFKAGKIAIGMTSGLLRLHPLLALMDVYAAALKMSVTLAENAASFQKILAVMSTHCDELDDLSRKAIATLQPELLDGVLAACNGVGFFIEFAHRTVLERALAPSARLSNLDRLDVARAIRDVEGASTLVERAKDEAQAKIELSALSVAALALQVIRLGERFDDKLSRLESANPTLGNRLSASSADLARTFADYDSDQSHGADYTTRAKQALEKVIQSAAKRHADIARLQSQFESLSVHRLATRARALHSL